MDLRETGLEGVDWINQDQDRDLWLALLNTVLNEHLGSMKIRKFLD
jgi:hypothetical protein